MTTNPIGNTGIQAPVNDRVPSKSLTQDDFMKMLIVQLKNQDPLKPTDGGQMLGQMSSISTVQAMTSMQQNFTQLRTDQQLTLGQGLINKTIQIANPSGGDVTGVVQKVTVTATDSTSGPKTQVNVTINGQDYPISGLESVLQTPAP